ncbi:MAG: SH3 domain-containing protein [Desulfuromonadaceae bacterium]|nr:SH3 domain-containing protein [Desulfuromonadaceae bacterium]
MLKAPTFLSRLVPQSWLNVFSPQRLFIFLSPPFSLILLSALILSGCAPQSGYLPHDLTSMPQHPLSYLQPESAYVELLSEQEHQALTQNFLAHHFSPWKAQGPLPETGSPFWAVEWIQSKPVFGLSLLALETDEIQQLVQQAAPQDYPSCALHAITLTHVDVRALPTAAPIFNDPRKVGEGFPFDYLQHGVLPCGTPVVVTHMSPERNWVFIETTLLYGWVPAPDIAWTDAAFEDTFNTQDYVVALEDNHPVRSTGEYSKDSRDTHLIGCPDAPPSERTYPATRIGTIFPLLQRSDGTYTVAVPTVDAYGNAVAHSAVVSTEAAHLFPLPFTPERVAALSTRFMGQPYSWGDRFSGRDCSGTMRDLFTPFGIWLPRNSSAQTTVGTVIPLENIPLNQRSALIHTAGIPFATLVHLPGHIMLYLGEYQGKIIVLHTLWGIRHHSFSGKESRIHVGRTVVTSLEPGAELDTWFSGTNSLLKRLDQINIPHMQQLPVPESASDRTSPPRGNKL